MASAPLNWLLKIGGETLKTTAKTLSEAINNLHDSVTSLSTTKADADTTIEALDNLETNKLNISDLLSLEEIEASTSLTGKGVTAEGAKQINDSLVSNVNELKTNFQAGVDSVYNAVVAKGSTPASKSLSDVVDGIEAIQTVPNTWDIVISFRAGVNNGGWNYSDGSATYRLNVNTGSISFVSGTTHREPWSGSVAGSATITGVSATNKQ